MEKDQGQWLQQLLSETPGYESEVFDRFSRRLLGLARNRLPANIAARVDPDDVVQSVFRTFFRRHSDGQFDFESAYDVWHLLAAITYRKVINTVKYHRRELRDAAKETPASASASIEQPRFVDPQPGPESVMLMIDYTRWILEQLPEQYQDVVRLRMEGYDVREVAERVDVSERTVKRVLARVRDLAAKRLARELDEEADSAE